jgi:hypothetical protein
LKDKNMLRAVMWILLLVLSGDFAASDSTDPSDVDITSLDRSMGIAQVHIHHGKWTRFATTIAPKLADVATEEPATTIHVPAIAKAMDTVAPEVQKSKAMGMGGKEASEAAKEETSLEEEVDPIRPVMEENYFDTTTPEPEPATTFALTPPPPTLAPTPPPPPAAPTHAPTDASTAAPASSTAAAASSALCENESVECDYWSTQGYCTHTKFLDYMQHMCKLSCGLCPTYRATATAPEPATTTQEPATAGCLTDTIMFCPDMIGCCPGGDGVALNYVTCSEVDCDPLRSPGSPCTGSYMASACMTTCNVGPCDAAEERAIITTTTTSTSTSTSTTTLLPSITSLQTKEMIATVKSDVSDPSGSGSDSSFSGEEDILFKLTSTMAPATHPPKKGKANKLGVASAKAPKVMAGKRGKPSANRGSSSLSVTAQRSHTEPENRKSRASFMAGTVLLVVGVVVMILIAARPTEETERMPHEDEEQLLGPRSVAFAVPDLHVEYGSELAI